MLTQEIYIGWNAFEDDVNLSQLILPPNLMKPGIGAKLGRNAFWNTGLSFESVNFSGQDCMYISVNNLINAFPFHCVTLSPTSSPTEPPTAPPTEPPTDAVQEEEEEDPCDAHCDSSVCQSEADAAKPGCEVCAACHMVAKMCRDWDCSQWCEHYETKFDDVYAAMGCADDSTDTCECK